MANSTADAKLMNELIQLASQRDIGNVLRAALVYNQGLWGGTVDVTPTAAGSRPSTPSSNRGRRRRGRSRSRGRTQPQGGSVPSVAAKAAPQERSLSAFIEQAANEQKQVDIQRASALRGESPQQQSLPDLQDVANRSARSSLLKRLTDERRQLRDAMTRLYKSNALDEVVIGLAKAANVRSRLANNYRERSRRGWETPDARSLEQDLRELGDPGEPEYWARLLRWPVYSGFQKDGQRNEVALVLQTRDGRSLWSDPKALPRGQLDEIRRVVPAEAAPPRIPSNGGGEPPIPPAGQVWQRLSDLIQRLEPNTLYGDDSSEWSVGTSNTSSVTTL